MPEIQQTRYDQLLRRVASIIGPGSKVGELITDLLPIFDVENMPGELLRLAGTRICMGGGALAPVVGQAGTHVLENPAGSGVLATIERVDFGVNTTATVRWGVVNGFKATAVGIGTEIFRDTREIPPQEPVCNVRQITEVALASGTNQSRLLGDTNLVLDPPNSVCVLAPGTSFEIGTTNTNVATEYGFMWRERVAEQSELNF